MALTLRRLFSCFSFSFSRDRLGVARRKSVSEFFLVFSEVMGLRMGLTRVARSELASEVKLSLVAPTSKMDSNREAINEKDTNKGYHSQNDFEFGDAVFG